MRTVKSRSKRLKRRSRLQRGGTKYAFDNEDEQLFNDALESYNNDKDLTRIISVINEIYNKYSYKSAAQRGMLNLLTSDPSIDDTSDILYDAIINNNPESKSGKSKSGGKRSRKRRRKPRRHNTRRH